MTVAGSGRIPTPPDGPTEERVPNAIQLRFIQWVLETSDEVGYGVRTKQAVSQFQEEHAIPVDSQTKIGPHTWALLMDLYHRKVRALTPWEVPAAPMRLGGDTETEQWLTAQIERLNQQQVPAAAAYCVRNQRIKDTIAAGNPPDGPLPLPDQTESEVQACIEALRWNQQKIDLLWRKAADFEIDPRVLLAVIFQEGTGSFNTNAEVPVQFWSASQGGYIRGGSGAQPDFARDLAAAMEHHILAKVKAYSHYAQAFREAADQAGLGDGNLFQYVNYNVPWVKERGWSVRPGCYATHTEWWRGLQTYFDQLAGEGATHAYSSYLTAHPIAAPSPPPAVRFVMTTNGTGHTELITNQPWIEAFPA